MLLESAGSAGLVSTASLGDDGDDDAGVVVAAASALLFRLKGHIFRPALRSVATKLFGPIGWGGGDSEFDEYTLLAPEQAMTIPLIQS